MPPRTCLLSDSEASVVRTKKTRASCQMRAMCCVYRDAEIEQIRPYAYRQTTTEKCLVVRPIRKWEPSKAIDLLRKVDAITNSWISYTINKMHQEYLCLSSCGWDTAFCQHFKHLLRKDHSSRPAHASINHMGLAKETVCWTLNVFSWVLSIDSSILDHVRIRCRPSMCQLSQWYHFANSWVPVGRTWDVIKHKVRGTLAMYTAWNNLKEPSVSKNVWWLSTNCLFIRSFQTSTSTRVYMCNFPWVK